MAPPPLSWLLRVAALCHLTMLLAGEWAGLLHELVGEPPAPLLPLRPDTRAPRPHLGKVHSNPFQRVWWRGLGSSLTPDSGLPLPLERFPVSRDSPPGPVSEVATAWQRKEVVWVARGCQAQRGVAGGGQGRLRRFMQGNRVGGPG